MTPERIRLYRPIVHVAIWALMGTLAVLASATGVVIAIGAAAGGDYRIAVAGPVLFALVGTILGATVFRTRRAYATADGLEVWCRRRRRIVPWSRVRQVDWAWWSTPPFRAVAVEVEGGRDLVFFGGESALKAVRRRRERPA